MFARDHRRKKPVELVPAEYGGPSGKDRAEGIRMELWLAKEQYEVDGIR